MFCLFIFSKVFFCNYILIVIKLHSLRPEDFQIFFPTVKNDLMTMGRRERGREGGAGKYLRDTDLVVVDYETKIGYR